ncbi:hypothetical protein DPMN_153192 [Dreissena polymorpha]|uniref:Uncharacterized protein n=1 Tax=Dreissena polymorpha TaxID=45954 RepID=A0A9D4J4K5_DREPO|nr:hypothetical protein DPMN_153192 [Dreissena polymorpha]
MVPDWYETLNMDRLGNTTTNTRDNQERKHYSVYSNDTVVNSTITRADRRSQSENDEVFEVAEVAKIANTAAKKVTGATPT